MTPDPYLDDLPDEWPARLDALVAGARRRRAEREQLRQEMATRRKAGKQLRHARRLAAGANRPTPTEGTPAP
jgi:hypothetical protein